MSGELDEMAEDLFLRATDLPAAERKSFLDRHCGDARLRAEVEELLRFHDGGLDGFLETPPRVEDVLEPVDARIGPYFVLRELGEGGFGIVYLAEQREPLQRIVAVKLLKLGMDTRQVVARFEGERQLLAMLNHPHIARVIDAGATPEGRPYFVMEYVPGKAITQYANEGRLDIARRLRLFGQVCDAILHAHQRGVMHRDIKPSNVLVDDIDGKPFAKVIDFGIAKAIGDREAGTTSMTVAGELVGTPEYMSPEQAGLCDTVDTRTDVYSLGVMLYELITGALPFDPDELRRAGLGESLRKIREEDPPRPSTRLIGLGDLADAVAVERDTEVGALRRELRGDLDWIVLKSMEKDPRRRYATVAELASDIDRYLRREPVLAGPPGAAYRARKFVARHRVGVAAGLLVLLALLLGLTVATVGFVEATLARLEISRKEEAAQRQAYRASIAAAGALIQSHNAPLARRTLDEVDPARRGWEWKHLDWLADTSLGTLAADRERIRFLTFSADGAALHFMTSDGTLHAWEPRSGKERAPIRLTEPVSWLQAAASPDGKRIACATPTRLSLHDIDARREVWSLPGNFALSDRAFHPDGSLLVARLTVESRASVRDAATGREVASFPLGFPGELPGFSPDGRKLLFKSWSSYASIDARDGTPVWEYPANGLGWEVGPLRRGGWQVAVLKDEGMTVLDGDTGRPLYHRNGIGGAITTAGFSRGGERLAVAETSGLIVILDSATGDVLSILHGQSGSVAVLSFSQDDKRLASGSWGGEVKLWDPFTSGGIRLATALGGTPEQEYVYGAAISEDGTRAATFGWGNVNVFDTETGGELWTNVSARVYLRCGAFSHDGRRVVAGAEDGTAMVFDAASGEKLCISSRLPVSPAVLGWTKAGDSIIAGCGDGRIRVLNGATATLERELQGHRSPVYSLAVSPDGSRVATGSGEAFPSRSYYSPPRGANDDSIRVWDREWREVAVLEGHRASVSCLAFDRNGSRLASGDVDGRLIVWSMTTYARLLEPSREGLSFSSLAFSPDGARLAGGRRTGVHVSLQLWDAATGDEAATFPLAVNTCDAIGFAGEGRALLAVGQGGSALAAFETGPPACGFEARDRVMRARIHVERLFEELLVSSEVVDRLRTDASLDEPLRRAAIDLAKARGDQVNYLNSFAWGVVRDAGRPLAECEAALRKAEACCRLWPGDYGFLNTLGVAQYRTGRYEAAVETLLRCDALYNARSGASHPFDLAVLAMARHRLGRKDASRAGLELLRERMREPRHAQDPETLSIWREAEALIDPQGGPQQ